MAALQDERKEIVVRPRNVRLGEIPLDTDWEFYGDMFVKKPDGTVIPLGRNGYKVTEAPEGDNCVRVILTSDHVDDSPTLKEKIFLGRSLTGEETAAAIEQGYLPKPE